MGHGGGGGRSGGNKIRKKKMNIMNQVKFMFYTEKF
jgi:hypothetical protein